MKARAKTRPKADEYEDINEDVFKHYDNKFFDMDSTAEDSKPSTIPVPEIQELQQYVTKCYDALYKDFNAFKSTVTNQLLSLQKTAQEEVQTLSFHKSGRNDDVFPEAVKESTSRYGFEATEGRTDKLSQWHSKARVEGYEEYEKVWLRYFMYMVYEIHVLICNGGRTVQQTPQFHHETRLHHRPDSRSLALTDEPSPRKHLVKRGPSYQTDDDLIQHIPASAWSTKMTESSSRGASQISNTIERKQEATYLSRHLHGSHSPSSNEKSRIKTRSGWSPEKNSNEVLSTSCAWQEDAEVESKEYEDAEAENEQAIEKMVSEFSNHQSSSRSNDQGFSNGQGKAGAAPGRDRFTLHGWAASFIQQPTDVQLPKVNKQYIKQEIHKFNDKERTSKCEDTRGGEVRTEQSVAEMDITSKRPAVALAKGSLSRSNSQDLKQAKNMSYMNLNSSKPTAADHETRAAKDSNQRSSDNKFPGKKCRGGIAWTVDELAEQNKQRAVN